MKFVYLMIASFIYLFGLGYYFNKNADNLIPVIEDRWEKKRYLLAILFVICLIAETLIWPVEPLIKFSELLGICEKDNKEPKDFWNEDDDSFGDIAIMLIAWIGVVFMEKFTKVKKVLTLTRRET